MLFVFCWVWLLGSLVAPESTAAPLVAGGAAATLVADTTRLVDDAFVERARLELPAFLNSYKAVLVREEPSPGRLAGSGRETLSTYAIGKDEFAFRQVGRRATVYSYAVMGNGFVVDEKLRVGMSKNEFAQHFKKSDVADMVVVTDAEATERYVFAFRKNVLRQIRYQAK